MERARFLIEGPPGGSPGPARVGGGPGREPEAPPAEASTLVVLWHGAGGDIDERSLVAVARAFAAAGAVVARARFPYRVAGKRMPDRMPALIAAARATIEEVRATAGMAGRAHRLVLGGRSMGGRVTSMLVAGGFAADALVFLSYPLHPKGKLEELRSAHLPDVNCPMLFVTGDRDELADMTLLRPVLEGLGPRARLALHPGADHSLRKVDAAALAAEVVMWARSVLPAQALR